MQRGCQNKVLKGYTGLLPTFTYTVKPLYSEQSRDPKTCSLYGGVHPRGVRYGHAHMCQKWVPPEIQCTHVCILKLTSQIYLIFESLISLNFSNKFKFFRFANMLTKTD